MDHFSTFAAGAPWFVGWGTLALINAAFPAFLVYGLNRYAYYVTPFMAGATGLLGAVLFEWLIKMPVMAIYSKIASRPRAIVC